MDIGGGIIVRYEGDREEVTGITLIGLRARLLRELDRDNRADSNDKRKRLIRNLQRLTPEMRSLLEELKDRGRRDMKRPDIVWRFLLQSSSTWGNSRGWDGLIEDQGNYRRVTFDALSQLSTKKRIKRLEETLVRAKVRMPSKKARYLSENFAIIRDMGGLAAARRAAMSQTGRDAKMAFMRSFKGIGPKYARNV